MSNNSLKTFKCKTCGIERIKKRLNQIYCSYNCRFIGQKGHSPKNIKLFGEKGKATRFQKGLIPKHKLNIDKSELEKYYILDGLTLEQIAKIYNCSFSTIFNYLVVYNIPRRPSGFQDGNTVQVKEKHYKWQGGITPFNSIIRGCKKMTEWKKEVFYRDGFSCVKCGSFGCVIHAHHIEHFSSIMLEYNIKTEEDAFKCDKLWDINNGMTLCVMCHKKIHLQEGEKSSD